MASATPAELYQKFLGSIQHSLDTFDAVPWILPQFVTFPGHGYGPGYGPCYGYGHGYGYGHFSYFRAMAMVLDMAWPWQLRRRPWRHSQVQTLDLAMAPRPAA